MNCAVMQPAYIPWRGYFHLIRKSELFVFFDDVQYTRRSWRNRNRIRIADGARWLTIPVHSRHHQLESTPIRDIRINWATKWNRSHREILHQCYRNAPHYGRYRELLDDFYSREPEFLADFIIDFTCALAGELGISGTRYLRSSDLEAEGEKTARVVSLLSGLGADHLINGPSAREYTDHEALKAAGISYEYMVYDYPEYLQLHQPFIPDVSILDLLFMAGPRAPEYIWGGEHVNR